MAHVRALLRGAAVTAVTGLTTTGARVKTGRVYALADDGAPALTVNTTDETSEPVSIHAGGMRQRTVTLEVIGHARDVGDLAGTLDTIAAEVETALSDGLTVSGVRVPLTYTGTSIDFGSLDQPVGQVRMTWSADLFTAAGTPGTLAQA